MRPKLDSKQKPWKINESHQLRCIQTRPRQSLNLVESENSREQLMSQEGMNQTSITRWYRTILHERPTNLFLLYLSDMVVQLNLWHCEAAFWLKCFSDLTVTHKVQFTGAKQKSNQFFIEGKFKRKGMSIGGKRESMNPVKLCPLRSFSCKAMLFTTDKTDHDPSDNQLKLSNLILLM